MRKAILKKVVPFCHTFCNKPDPTGPTLLKFYIRGFFENLLREFKVKYNVTIIMSILLEYRYIFLIISGWILLNIRKLLNRFVQKITIHVLRLINISLKSSLLCDNVENIIQPDRQQCALCAEQLRGLTHWEYVIIIAFPLQQWLRERNALLRYT